MNETPGDPRDEALATDLREALRALVGAPPPRLMDRTLNEVEIEVLYEDLVILMVEAGSSALRGFLDLAAVLPAESPADDAKREE